MPQPGDSIDVRPLAQPRRSIVETLAIPSLQGLFSPPSSGVHAPTGVSPHVDREGGPLDLTSLHSPSPARPAFERDKSTVSGRDYLMSANPTFHPWSHPPSPLICCDCHPDRDRVDPFQRSMIVVTISISDGSRTRPVRHHERPARGSAIRSTIRSPQCLWRPLRARLASWATRK